MLQSSDLAILSSWRWALLLTVLAMEDTNVEIEALAKAIVLQFIDNMEQEALEENPI
jgi:hypothetical protein